MPRAGNGAGDGWSGHAAAVVGSDDQLVATSLAFVRQGLADDDLVVIGCRRPVEDLLTEALGERADAVEFDERICLFAARAPEVFEFTTALSARAAGRGSGRLRVLAQVDFGTEPREVHEGQCFEAAVNGMQPRSQLASLCLYDTRRLPPGLVHSARATHPHLVEHGARRPNDSFVEPSTFVRGLPVPREPLEDGSPLIEIADAPTLVGLRHALGDALATVVRDRDQREDLHLAISEMAANAFRHGGRPVSARLWASPDRVVCAVTDSGTGIDDPLYGYWPAHGEDLGLGGMGLWLARKLCDHVDLLPGHGGLTVRLNTALR